jgi:hypothetical protein
MKIEKVYQKGKRPRWRVNDPGLVPRGTMLEWTLMPDPQDKKNPVEAHFQFGHDDLVQNAPKSRSLTRDLTAMINKPRGTLKLKLKDEACRRKNPRRYAVWVKDDTLPHGGTFAVGEDMNPPPEIDVGG